MEKKTLAGVNGNAFCVMGTVSSWMKEACSLARQRADKDGINAFDEKAIDAYTNEAMSSDYGHLLSVSVEMVDKINDYCCKK